MAIKSFVFGSGGYKSKNIVNVRMKQEEGFPLSTQANTFSEMWIGVENKNRSKISSANYTPRVMTRICK